MRLRNSVVIFILMIIIVFSTGFLIGCKSSPKQESNNISSPIYVIRIFERLKDTEPVPLEMWGIYLGPPPGPYPKDVQKVFTAGEKMSLGLNITSGPVGMNTGPAGNITFSKFTFYSRDTGNETQVGSSDDLGPYELHSIVLIDWPHPWPVPDEPGMYELRVYLGNSVLASAVFEVK